MLPDNVPGKNIEFVYFDLTTEKNYAIVNLSINIILFSVFGIFQKTGKMGGHGCGKYL